MKDTFQYGDLVWVQANFVKEDSGLIVASFHGTQVMVNKEDVIKNSKLTDLKPSDSFTGEIKNTVVFSDNESPAVLIPYREQVSEILIKYK